MPVSYLEIESDALRSNRLGDPHVRQVAVYQPETQQPSPSLYFLPSHGRTNHYYLGWQQWDESIQQRLDRLIADGIMPPTIVVFPDCWTRLGGSQFLDSAIGNYASHLIDEVIPAVDAAFSTIADPTHRGVLGHSSGGYGALALSMRYPGIFGGLAARAPDAYWQYSALPAVARLHQQLERWGGFAEFIEAIPGLRPKKSDFWQAIHTVMQCMAYAPNPDASLGFDPPVDLETGALIPDVWNRWLEHDPVHMLDVPEYQTALRLMRMIFLEVGSFDEYQLQVGARLLHRKLSELAIAHEYQEFPDGHSGTSYRLDVALPMLAKALQ